MTRCEEGKHVREGRRLSCSHCGKIDPEELRSVRLDPFRGAASLSPAVERFWATGDPSVFDGSP